MKVIDLLNKIANREIKQGTKIKFMNMEFIYDFPNLCGVYKARGSTFPSDSLFYFLDACNINNDVELIEDQTIDIDSIEELVGEVILHFDIGKIDEVNYKNNLRNIAESIESLKCNQNQLIRALKHLNKEIQSIKEK